MAYSSFTLTKVKQAFGLNTVEDISLFPDIESVLISDTLINYLETSIPLATKVNTEKIRSEGIIYPILLEVKKLLSNKISLFSGEEFNVDYAIGLNGVCDFLISYSPEQIVIEAPVAIIIEAKKGDLKVGIGQCIASMVAAQRFNQENNNEIESIYGCVTSGSLWKFFKLKDSTVEMDFNEYGLFPVENIISKFVYILKTKAKEEKKCLT